MFIRNSEGNLDHSVPLEMGHIPLTFIHLQESHLLQVIIEAPSGVSGKDHQVYSAFHYVLRQKSKKRGFNCIWKVPLFPTSTEGIYK